MPDLAPFATQGRFIFGQGKRWLADLTTCSDIDMMSANADGRFVHKDGTPYPER